MYNKKWSQQIYSNPNNFQSTFIQVPQQPNYPTNQLTQQPFQQSLIHPYQPPKQFFQQQLQPVKQPSLSLGQQFQQQFQQNLQQFQPLQKPQFQKPPQQFLPFQNPQPQPQQNNNPNQQQQQQPFFQEQLQPVKQPSLSLGQQPKQQFQQNLQQPKPQFQKPPQQFLPFQNPPFQQNNQPQPQPQPQQFFQQQLQPVKQPSLSLGQQPKQQFQQNLQQPKQPFQKPQFQKPPQQFLPFQNPPPQQNNNLINQQQETQPFFQQPVHSTLISTNFSNLPLPYINLQALDQQKFQLDHPILRKRPNSKRNDLQISNNQKEEKDPNEEKFGYRLHLKTDDIAKLKTKLGLIKTFLEKKGTTINKINFSAVLVSDPKSSFHDCMASIKKVSELLCIYVNLDEELKRINKNIRQYIDWTNHIEAKFGPVKYHVKFASQNRVLQDFNHLIKLFVAKLENGSIKPKYLSKKNSSKSIQNSSNYKKRRVLNRSDRNQNTNQININTRQYQENKRWDGGNVGAMGYMYKQRGGGRGRGRGVRNFHNNNTNFY
ncbi:hypothetical protein M0813_05633 [Anaeramoeba flamelloides]|uniref:Uncharacterized protein n=1 Tax=Anaeramoeba flamelloides TaxID=1746091 RepID=A0ABQ8XHG5_9EUKA|nr:hypothetical protein M0813_05633 [Anaeramoeba flamelloides]